MKLLNKKLKATTLVEVILYLGLFGFIFTTIISFSLVINEFNKNDKYQVDLAKSAIFIVEHIDESFKNSKSIDAVNSTFDNNSGVLTLVRNDNSTIKYSIANNRISALTTASNFISPNDITISKFKFERIIENTVVVGVRFELNITSTKNSRISKSIIYTYVIQ